MRSVFGNRRSAKRYLPSSNLEIVARLSLTDVEGLAVLGRVKNLNEIGIMFEIGNCQLDNHDLGVVDSCLEIILALPKGTIQIKGSTIYCRPLNPSEPGDASLLGVKIVAMSRDDEVMYREFLRTLG
jgi:hypothetical protein